MLGIKSIKKFFTDYVTSSHRLFCFVDDVDCMAKAVKIAGTPTIFQYWQ